MTKKAFPYPDDVELTHEHGGNGWAMVQWFPEDDYAYIAAVTPSGVSDRAYLAWVKKLKPTMHRADPMNPDSPLSEVKLSSVVMEQVELVRNDLISGKKKISQTYIRTI